MRAALTGSEAKSLPRSSSEKHATLQNDHYCLVRVDLDELHLVVVVVRMVAR
jgi:hypothetical protein